MLIGVPKETKLHEYRAGLTPSSVKEIVNLGGVVWVEKDLGLSIGISNLDYELAGAQLVDNASEIYHHADLIVKVKEPQPEECRQLRAGQTIFTYLHLAPDPLQTRLLKESGVTAIAYETVTNDAGGLPLLIPMSQIAGRMAVQAGAHCLEKTQGGSGLLLSGASGVAPCKVLVLGGGVVGTNAIRIALGMGAFVTVIDQSVMRLRQLDEQFGFQLKTIYATSDALEQYVTDADLVIGAVLVPGAAAPRLVTKNMLYGMRPGSVLVDVAIDQGGCFETSRATTHQEPTYIEEKIVHYCVANMPGAVPKTATYALNNATLPFILNMVKHGVMGALLHDPHLLQGLNVHNGHITYAAVAKNFNYSYVSPQQALNIKDFTT